MSNDARFRQAVDLVYDHPLGIDGNCCLVDVRGYFREVVFKQDMVVRTDLELGEPKENGPSAGGELSP